MTIVERGICRSGKNLIVLEAGSAVEEIQNCHIGGILYGGLSHAWERFFIIVSTAVANPRCCFFALFLNSLIHL